VATLVGPLILLVCVGFLVLTFRRAMISRRDFARVRGGPLYGTSTPESTTLRADSIEDGGNVPAQELLAALGAAGASEVNADGEEDGASGLGLRMHAGSATNQLPQVMEGTRGDHQVFVRQGLVGDSVSPGLRMRRTRTITVVRVAAPSYEAEMANGRIEVDANAEPTARDFLSMLAPSPDVWHDGRLVSGPEGIVVSRAAANDWLGGWIYDLWLLERLARDGGGSPLPAVKLSRDWEAPYGLHSWSPGLLDGRRG
jgi:hypothetical protein